MLKNRSKFLIALLCLSGLILSIHQAVGQDETLVKAFTWLQEGSPEKAISELEKMDLATDTSGQARLFLAIAHFLLGEVEKGEPYAIQYLEIEEDPNALSGALYQFGNALVSPEIDKARQQQKVKERSVSQALNYFRNAIALESNSSHDARLSLANALLMFTNLPEMKIEERQAKIHFTEADTLLREFLEHEPEGERAASARLFLCGHPECTPLQVFDIEAMGSATGSTDSGMKAQRIEEGEVSPPVKISAPPPQYTRQALEARIHGQVVLQTIIDKKGKIAEIRVLSGLPGGLTEAAVAAVRNWTFEPARLEGTPVPVYYNLSVNFRLNPPAEE